MRKTYWIKHPRDFANEYYIGVATCEAGRYYYEHHGYRRIGRDDAIKAARRQGTVLDEMFVVHLADTGQVSRDEWLELVAPTT